ncbi:PAS domain-containing protein [Paludisphaera rhizosphaerae]|uniref:PAS domain-containing protein n=1 Tax=Paludisphaera rhizosphaerae TaxID=2711216 RepID=UPI0013EB3CE5|nr:PAS domain-containing protein [Paludisphaera rhizosphaerae]
MLARYLAAAAAVAAAAGLTAVSWPLAESTPFAAFFAAVMLVAWVGGVGPSLLATALSIPAVTYWFVPPYHSFGFRPESAAGVVVFGIVAMFMAAFAAARSGVEARERSLQRRFEEIATSIADAVATTDASGHVTFLNAAAERLSGWSSAEAAGRSIRDVFSTTVGPADEALASVPGPDAVRRFDCGVITGRDGVVRAVEGSVAPIFDEQGRIVGTVLSCRDVSDRLRDREALRRTEALNREMLDAGLDCLKTLSLDGRILSINETGLRMMDVDEFETIKGREWAELWPESARFRVREAVRRAASGEPDRFEAPCPTVKNVPKEWEVHLTPILGADGRPERLYCVSRDVTDRMKAAAELRVSEERYRSLFNSIDEGFCVIEMIFDEAGKPVDFLFLEANPAYAGLTGLGQVVGKRMREIIPDHDEHWFETYGKVALTGEPVRFVNTAEKMGGQWFDVYASPAGGRKVAVLFQNVTAAVLAERERERLLSSLNQERANLEAVVQSAPAFICTLRGPDHVFTLANRLYYEMVGDRDLIGRPVREAFPDLEGQGFFELLDQVFRSGEPFVGKEMPILFRRDGGAIERRFLNFVYQAVIEGDGVVSGIFVHGVDVTDMVVARETVRDSEARFRQLADAMPQAVWAARSDGTVDYFNRKWREYGDYPEGVLGGPRWARIIHPDDVDRARDAWQESVRTGRPFEVEYRLRRASDGTHRWHLGRALPIEDSRGRIVRWFGTNTDVDDVKRLSEALQQADRRKDEFLATLAHELRNPLAPLSNGLQLLELGQAADAARSTIGMMTRQLGHMVHLIDDLMDVARVRSGKISLRKQRVELQAVAAGAVEAGRQYIEAGRHELTATMPPEPIPLDADPTRLTQVISNLLNNAAKYTEPGGRIDLTVTREGAEAVVSVRDTGVGIAPEMLPKVFDMFTQVDASLHRAQGGLGVGLTIVRRLVEMHGGRIEVRSEGVGKGSEFRVHLPIADVAPVAANPARPEVDEVAPAGAIRVLVVDDVRDSADSLSRLLTLDGHDVHTAYDGAQALAEASAFPPDVILLDLGLPDKNGFEVAAELRADPAFRDAMLVALTGWGQPEDRRRSGEVGFDHHLVKPVEIDVLRNILSAVAQSTPKRGRTALAVRGGS